MTRIHAASILAWVDVAKAAGVPHIPAELVATIPMEDIYNWMDGRPYSEEAARQMQLATDRIVPGSFWRFDLCAPAEVKMAMGRGEELPDIIPLNFDDGRFFDIHHGSETEAKVVFRPRVEPIRVNGYPVEFRTFFGGLAEDGAVSFYYPQAGRFEVTGEMQALMDQARDYGAGMHRRRLALGLKSWVPGVLPDDDIVGDVGSTIDFMFTTQGLLFVDAGPGWGYGADPCCFWGEAVKGEKWWCDMPRDPRRSR